MKKTFNVIVFITTFALALAACGGQSGRKDNRSDLSDLSEDMQEVVQNIDEAISTNEVSDFKDKTENVINSLDKRIDDYLNEMDKVERRVEKNTQNLVIEMKQKKVEVELKLALLEQDDNWPEESGTDASQRDAALSDKTAVNDRPEITSTDGDMKRGTDTQGSVMYGSQMVDNIKSDLRELKRSVEQFMQTSLSYQDNN